MDLDIFAENIKKTGFVLEYDISCFMEKKGWSVINNRYYVDDVQKSIREIDIIAYKSKSIGDINVYTTMIISCKKNEDEVWAFLSKKINIDSPNINWNPLHIWSNEPIMQFSLKQPEHDKNYFIKNESSASLFYPQTHIFAFQQMKRSTGKVGNDKDIYSSITSLMKSQSYEISSLDKRKKTKCVYFFYLISILDGDIILLKCENGKISPKKIKQEHYISDYIINYEHTSARIHFTNKDNFQDIIEDYNNLHDYNCKHVLTLENDFYIDAISSSQKKSILIEKINKEKITTLRRAVYDNTDKFDAFKISSIYIFGDDDILYISLSKIRKENIELMNGSVEVEAAFRDILNEVFRTEIFNIITFEEEIPF